MITRKQVENYYEQEWTQIVSTSTVDLLIELTCQAYQLNHPPVQVFLGNKELQRPQKLGQI